MKKFCFEVPESAWNYVAEKALPNEEEGMFCILIVEFQEK